MKANRGRCGERNAEKTNEVKNIFIFSRGGVRAAKPFSSYMVSPKPVIPFSGGGQVEEEEI